MAKCRLQQEEVDMTVSQLQECSYGTIHGTFVGDVSPIKSSRKRADVKYFDGWISDKEATATVVSFMPKLRENVERACNTKEAIAITNCIVQRSKTEGCKNLEIVVGSHSNVQNPPKKFSIDNEKVQLQCDEGDAVKVKPLDEIIQMAVHQRITIEGKVQSVEKIEKVKVRRTMLHKQDVIIADATGA